jgi:hypothetical protein
MIKRLSEVRQTKAQTHITDRSMSNEICADGGGIQNSPEKVSKEKNKSEHSNRKRKSMTDLQNSDEDDSEGDNEDFIALNMNPKTINISSSNSSSSAKPSSISSGKIFRVVIHLDMDCFFVSAVLRSDSMAYLRDQPVAVAHSSDTPYTPSPASASTTTSISDKFSLSPSKPATISNNRSPSSIPSSTSSSSSFSSSSEISSCNYPARASGDNCV